MHGPARTSTSPGSRGSSWARVSPPTPPPEIRSGTGARASRVRPRPGCLASRHPGAPPMDAAPAFGPPLFRRVLLKLSGESFCRPGEGGISIDEVSRIARQARRVAERGVELAIVVGGGNILRGATLTRGSDVIQEATAH